jgi:hypothetical protein
MAKTPLKPLSQAIFEPVTKAYKAGGFGLAFLTLGAFLMLAAFFLPDRGRTAYAVVATGFILIALACVLFLVKDVLPLLRARRRIKESSDLIDAVQSMALQMTEVASDLQSLAFKHATTVATVMQEARPLLRKIPLPLVGKFADSDIVVRADSLSTAIVDYTATAKKVISDVEDALVTSDATSLKQYANDLDRLRSGLAVLLKT